MQQADCSLIVNTRPNAEPWCVYEHHVALEAGQPPQVIHVGACRLIDAFRLGDARQNTEWQAIFEHGGHVLVRIVSTTDNRMEAIQAARAHLATFNPMPRCNMHGYNARGTARPVRCSNGITYRTQSEAANALGITQSAVSQHLAGHIKSAGGFTFEYA